MIHNATCNIVIPPAQVGQAGLNILGIGAEPPIPTDAELDDVFQEWRAKGKIFIARAAQEEGREGLDTVTQQDMFRWGMKYAICEAKKIIEQ